MTAYQSTSLNTKVLKALYTSDPIAKHVLDDFGSRKRNQGITKLDQLIQRLSTSGKYAPRTEVIAVLRKLEDAGCGKFLTGRRGHASRFEWQYDLVGVAKAATGEVQEVEEIQPTAQSDSGDEDEKEEIELPEVTIEHKYQLRANWQVALSLPSDLTSREATRLSEFIKTLPFNEPE